MQDFFYSILIAILVVVALYVFTTDDIKNDGSKLDEYSGYVVTNKSQSFFLDNIITLRKDSLHYRFTSEDIIFEQFSVGDTLK